MVLLQFTSVVKYSNSAPALPSHYWGRYRAYLAACRAAPRMMHVGLCDRAVADESALAMESSESVLPRRFLRVKDPEDAAVGPSPLSSMM